MPLHVVCLYRGGKGGLYNPGLPHISPGDCGCAPSPAPSRPAPPPPLPPALSWPWHPPRDTKGQRGGGGGHPWASGSPAGSGCSRQSSVAPRHLGACGRLGFRQLFCSHVLSAVAYQNSHFILKQQFFRAWGSCTDPLQKPGGCPGSGRGPRGLPVAPHRGALAGLRARCGAGGCSSPRSPRRCALPHPSAAAFTLPPCAAA